MVSNAITKVENCNFTYILASILLYYLNFEVNFIFDIDPFAVDFIRVNGQPLFIRLSSNAVREPHFTAPKPFDELLAALFDEPAADATTRSRVAEYWG